MWTVHILLDIDASVFEKKSAVAVVFVWFFPPNSFWIQNNIIAEVHTRGICCFLFFGKVALILGVRFISVKHSLSVYFVCALNLDYIPAAKGGKMQILGYLCSIRAGEYGYLGCHSDQFFPNRNRQINDGIILCVCVWN